MRHNKGHSNRTTQAMSEEQLKAFQEAVKADVGLQQKLKEAGDADAVVAIAKAAGFLISAEELQMSREEISEKELEGVAMPIMTRLYQEVIPGGIVCMPGIEWYGRRCFLLPAHTLSNHRGGRLILR